jgi:hypothetical protein
VTSEKDIITGTRKLGMNANLTQDGKLKSGIHSLQGDEQRAGTITRRTSADEPDPVKTQHGGSGKAKSRSKYYGE